MSSTRASSSRATGPSRPAARGVSSLGPGSVVGDFRIERTLGYGGMGVVHEATQLSLDRPVALKVMSGRHAVDPVMRARFAREARVQASVQSPYVVQVLAHGEHEGLLWTATQLIAGGDLAAVLRADGTPPLAVALDLVRQVAAGVADAHAVGLVHRDIKPANILLDRTGGRIRVLVADFGIARTPDSDLTETAGMLGTASYMAPELHHGVEASAASDVYALGCLLWAVLVGEAPYAWSTGDYQLMTAHIAAPVPVLVGNGREVDRLNAVLARALAKDPVARFASAADFRDAVAAV
ncbi:serine/threonine protein kinase [Nocardioides sp. JQ2195]|uniref:serine/threonine-protein kinase n=1 Tax=Nocardioides sp. JQ2195 TaxID=2592334 RepID=UPI00143EBD91|nr:serine/threonine-protein kinase [Nocardioides sp. JQ2195]QIX25316.1 serine/threonine protein kinase [Nocardioides sp. JQ2195]